MAFGAAEDNVRSADLVSAKAVDVAAAARRLHVGAGHVELAAGPRRADAARAAGAQERRGRGAALGRAGLRLRLPPRLARRPRWTRPHRRSSRSTPRRWRARSRRSTTSSSATSRTSIASGSRSSHPTARTPPLRPTSSCLPRTYDALKAVDPTLRVWGGALAPRGSDRPDGIRPDVLADRVPQGARRRVPRERPDAARHGRPRVPSVPGQLLAEPRLPAPALDEHRPRRLRQARRAARRRRSTGPPSSGASLPILYDEFGIESDRPRREEEPLHRHRADDDEARRRAPAGGGLRPRPPARVLPADRRRASSSSTRTTRTRSRAGSRASTTRTARPKASFWAVPRLARSRARRLDRAVRRGSPSTSQITNLRFPGPREFLSGKRDTRFRCTYDCSWELVATRTTTGAVAARVRGYGRYGRTLVASLNGRKLGNAPVRLSLTVVHPVNPGVPCDAAERRAAPRLAPSAREAVRSR